MKQLLVLVLSLFILSACDMSSIIELVYFDRIKYTFPDKDNAKERIYMCVKGASEKDSRQRAEKAHQFMVDNLEKLSQEYINTPSFVDKGGDTMYGDALKKIEDGSEKIMTDLEEQFQCAYVGDE